MAHEFRTEERIAASADDVLALMIDQETHEALLAHLGTTVESIRHDRDGDRMTTVVTTAEPAMQGATTHRATLEAIWDLPSRTCTWSRADHTFGDRVKATGRTEVVADGDRACKVVESGSIDIKVPVIGKKIGKKVVAAMQEMAPKKARFWADKLR